MKLVTAVVPFMSVRMKSIHFTTYSRLATFRGESFNGLRATTSVTAHLVCVMIYGFGGWSVSCRDQLERELTGPESL